MLNPHQPKPDWLRTRFASGKRYGEIKSLLRVHGLHTVCEEARCPNIGECFNAGEATFMILGDVCTRACGFCNVASGRPEGVDLLEPWRLANAVAALELDYVVLTSVNRDDLPDGGASVWAACIRAIHHRLPKCRVEVLTPDFAGDWQALQQVVEAQPVVYNHNVETVPRLYSRVRPRSEYSRSLGLLAEVKRIEPSLLTKSSVMVGLGETSTELTQVFRDLREHGVDLLTVGQYLQPTQKHLAVERYYHPDEFLELQESAIRLGFRNVQAGPLVRSSYRAWEQVQNVMPNQ